MYNRKIRTLILATACIAVMAAGSITAYFTDADTVTNTFTVGSVSLDLQEPNWDPEDAENTTPNKRIKEDPQIKNDGINTEFVFMEVVMPYANIVTANTDGTKNPIADTELYSYNINSAWAQVGTAKKNTAEKTITYLYVYGDNIACKELAKGQTTPTLFDTVTFVNAIEDQKLEGTSPKIVINAYGIQSTDINGGKTAPADVWAILSTQAPSTTVPVQEDAKTDVKK